jgi:hypothetical protein
MSVSLESLPPENPDNPIELYDLSNDLGEKKNVANEYPKIVNKMAKIMNEARTSNHNFKLYPSTPF